MLSGVKGLTVNICPSYILRSDGAFQGVVLCGKNMQSILKNTALLHFLLQTKMTHLECANQTVMKIWELFLLSAEEPKQCRVNPLSHSDERLTLEAAASKRVATLCNFSCNLSRNATARQVAGNIGLCITPC